MPARISLDVDPPGNGQYFTSKEVLKGRVIVNLEKSTTIKKISVKFFGASEVTVRSDDHNMDGTRRNIQSPPSIGRSFHEIVSQELQVFPPSNVVQAMNGSERAFKVEEGEHDYRFEFKVPKRAKCWRRHRKNSNNIFRGAISNGIPPSFNDRLRKNQISDVGTYLYSLGRVEYRLEAALYYGRSLMWPKPFKSADVAEKRIELIPGDSASRLVGESLTPAVTPATILDSKYVFTLEDGTEAWTEVHADRLKSVYRLDLLFQQGCGKFDKIYVAFSNLETRDTLQLRLVRLQLNLLEFVTYLAGEIGNRNLSSLCLLNIATDLSIDPKTLRQRPDDDVLEAPLNLLGVEALQQFRFNEQDYKHKGNRLFSFTSCNIRREYRFQLFLDFKDENQNVFQTETQTNIVNIFCESITVQENPPPYCIDKSTDTLPVYVT
ncbi:LAMI_0F07382g1_1 [Lachancea mirantina]|uniref:LAMI_0F07382g1_1 n=1 Tax=Lachancea mirantina TaxID=1230905 RepID=A0A1G4JZN8_9SACH|nr:LAMI_0F07382g1_1 [Lachancea mirantina]